MPTKKTKNKLWHDHIELSFFESKNPIQKACSMMEAAAFESGEDVRLILKHRVIKVKDQDGHGGLDPQCFLGDGNERGCRFICRFTGSDQEGFQIIADDFCLHTAEMDGPTKGLVSILWCCTSEQRCKEIEDVISQFGDDPVAENASDPEGFPVFLLDQVHGNFVANPLGFVFSPLERGNYDPLVLQKMDRIREDLGSRYPRGRIAIIEGPPGTGKTHLLRSLTDIPACSFVYLPAQYIALLNSSSIVSMAMATRSIGGGKTVFLVEDADHALNSRMADNANEVSTLLNIGDGMLSELLDIRFVLTSNTERKDVDKALTRDGRLSEFVSVGRIGKDHARSILRRLLGDSFGDTPVKDTMSLAEVYAMARDLGWKPPPDKQRPVPYRPNVPRRVALTGRAPLSSIYSAGGSGEVVPYEN